jgi:subtilisin family serine protease
MGKMQLAVILLGLVKSNANADILVRKHASSSEMLPDANDEGIDSSDDSTAKSSPARGPKEQTAMEIDANGNAQISQHFAEPFVRKQTLSSEIVSDAHEESIERSDDSTSKSSLVRDSKQQTAMEIDVNGNAQTETPALTEFRQKLKPEQGLASTKAESESARGKSHTTYIAGVPVYNMHKASDPDGWILKFPSNFTDAQLQSICQEASCTMMGHPSEGAASIVSIHTTQEALTALLQNHPEVEYADHDDVISPIPEVTDDSSSSVLDDGSSWSSPWGLDRIDDRGSGGDNSYDLGAEGAGVHVYVLDTGIRISHSDFGGRASAAFDCTCASSWSCSTSSSCTRSGLGNPDADGHGTHCAGTVAGRTYGVAKGARVYAGKVLGYQAQWGGHRGYTSWIANGIDWVVTKGRRPAVISMSLGGPGRSRTYEDEINAAHNAGVVVVVAAGNDNDNACNYAPAFVPNAVTVGSTTTSDARSGFSNYGSCVDIFAPGSSILSASSSSNTGSRTYSGTSMACPHVAGAVAVLKSRQPSLTAAQLVQKLNQDASTNKVSNANGSPNKLLYVDSRRRRRDRRRRDRRRRDRRRRDCFPSAAKVYDKKFGHVRIDSLQQGSFILSVDGSGRAFYDEVSFYSLADPKRKLETFFAVGTSTNRVIRITGAHHLPVGPQCCDKLKIAKELRVGDLIWTVAPGDQAATLDTVKSIETVVDDGMHSPVMLHGGHPIVDGVVTSFDDRDSITMAARWMPFLTRLCTAWNMCGTTATLIKKYECFGKGECDHREIIQATTGGNRVTHHANSENVVV